MNTDKDKGDLSQEAEKEEQTAFSEKPWKEIFVSCIPIALVCLLVWLDESILATAIPKISDEFDSFDQIGWYGPSYLFGLCSSQLPLGKAYQEFPTRITYLIFLLVFEVASIVQAAAPSSPAFIIGRILAGIGGAGILTGSLTIFSATIPKAKIPYVMGSFSWVHSIGTIAGPLVGGAITSSSLTWRWCFYLNPILSAVAIGPVLYLWRGKFNESPKDKSLSLRDVISRFDYFGTVVFAAASVILLLALQFGGSTYTWSQWRTIVSLTIAGTLFLIFPFVESWKGPNAMVPLKIVRKRAVSLSMLYTFILDGAYFILVYEIPLWFQAVLGLSARDSGYHILPLLVSCIFGSITGTTLTGKFHRFHPCMLVGAIILTVGSGVTTILRPESSAAVWVFCEILVGLGAGLGTSLPLVAVQDAVPRSEVPISYAVVLTAGYLGSSIALAIAQAVFASRLKAEIREGLPGFSPDAIVNAGATDLRNLVSGELYERALRLYNTALTKSWYISIILAGVSSFLVLGFKWKKMDMRDKK